MAGNSANGSTSDATADCNATSPFTFSGYSLFGDGTGCAGGDNADLTVTPTDIFTTVLGPLMDNGGDTLTHALLASSPAINGGYGLFCPDTDQRGFVRPFGSGCDIGAVEMEMEMNIIYLPLILK